MKALPILCRKSNEMIDDRLVSLLTFYSSPERNENLRLIVLESLRSLNGKFFINFPDFIFSLLLDDEEGIRMDMCKVLDQANPSCPAKTLKNFIELVGSSKFAKFLDNYHKNHLSLERAHLELFEKEPLNLFIDIQYLRKKFCP